MLQYTSTCGQPLILGFDTESISGRLENWKVSQTLEGVASNAWSYCKMALPAIQISQKQETHGDTIRANRKLRLGNHHDE